MRGWIKKASAGAYPAIIRRKNTPDRNFRRLQLLYVMFLYSAYIRRENFNHIFFVRRLGRFLKKATILSCKTAIANGGTAYGVVRF